MLWFGFFLFLCIHYGLDIWFHISAYTVYALNVLVGYFAHGFKASPFLCPVLPHTFSLCFFYPMQLSALISFACVFLTFPSLCISVCVFHFVSASLSRYLVCLHPTPPAFIVFLSCLFFFLLNLFWVLDFASTNFGFVCPAGWTLGCSPHLLLRYQFDFV